MMNNTKKGKFIYGKYSLLKHLSFHSYEQFIQNIITLPSSQTCRQAQFKEELQDQKLIRICVRQDRMGNKLYGYYYSYGLLNKKQQIYMSLTFLDSIQNSQ
ncbi:unnamed protein product [Paramecium octaurelia]|uniref:Uncharacterized protein n=1 Tax=Paramecium octaurelia TaxID=43137 RepID=A0A8S1W519_PAROT|nr:unnamed protein product [Paramecium octaurelia]